MGVRAVAFDFDGTAQTPWGRSRSSRPSCSRAGAACRATRPRAATSAAGDDFRTQLDAIAAGHPSLDDIAADFESAKEGLMGGCRPFADAGAAIDRLEAPTSPPSSAATRAELVQEFCRRHGLAERAAAVDGWRPDRPKVGQLRSWAAAIGVAPNDVLFVGDALLTPIARAAGVRFVGLSRPGHLDAFAGSGVPVVTSLTDLARLVVSARRSQVTVTIPAGEVGRPCPSRWHSPRDRAVRGGRPVGPHQPAHAVDDAYRRDGAVGDLDVPVDLGSRPKRPGDRGPHHGIVGEHHSRARGD